MAEAPQTPDAGSRGARRRRGLTLIAMLVLIAGIGYVAWWYATGADYVSTDNAYVQGNLVQVTPQVPGTVLAIRADDTDLVRAGAPLVDLDPADAKVALEQARAQLGQTVRETRVMYANNPALEATVAQRDAEVARLRSDLSRADGDLSRRDTLRATGAISDEDLQHARGASDSARSALAAAQASAQASLEMLSANRVLTDGTPVEQHPSVQRAAARVREAWLALSRASVPAPVSGHVARRVVQLGQRVQAGSPLMAIVPLEQVWVEANFKESQLRDVRIGQTVKLTADLYGSRIEYAGHVTGLAAGTGAAFALLPAQNATGNWIKVVQRLPVRIALDAKQLAAHPLRIGLSMQAEVDVRDHSGAALAAAPRQLAATQTDVFKATDRDADEDIRRIVAANMGAPRARGAAKAR